MCVCVCLSDVVESDCKLQQDAQDSQHPVKFKAVLCFFLNFLLLHRFCPSAKAVFFSPSSFACHMDKNDPRLPFCDSLSSSNAWMFLNLFGLSLFSRTCAAKNRPDVMLQRKLTMQRSK